MAAIAKSRNLLLELPLGSGTGQLGMLVASLAEALLGTNDAGSAAEEWIRAAMSGRLGAAADPAGTLANSLRISTGESAPDLEWALGLAWRSIYPAIVARFSHGGLGQDDHETFGLLAAELERLAFGPPPVNGAKLVALLEAGVLDLSELGQPGGDPSRTQLDAVTSGPGLHLHQAPLADLVAAGAVRVPRGSRGIEVTSAARCVGIDGTPTHGLSAIGRLTEDWVIGNDTLDRSLHREINRWAASVCGSVPPGLAGADTEVAAALAAEPIGAAT